MSAIATGTTAAAPAVTPPDIEAAAHRLAGHVRTTPVISMSASDLDLPVPVLLKLELLQHAGSFKPRGAFNRLLSLPTRPERVIAASGGNHGAAVAYAARALRWWQCSMPTRKGFCARPQP